MQNLRLLATPQPPRHKTTAISIVSMVKPKQRRIIVDPSRFSLYGERFLFGLCRNQTSFLTTHQYEDAQIVPSPKTPAL